MKYSICIVAAMALVSNTSAITLARNETAKSIPEFVDQYHSATMADANEKDAARVKAINDQAASDSWRGKKNGPTNSAAQITKDWGAKTDEATVAKMHEETMKFAGHVDGNAKGAVEKQESSDEWRGTGTKTAWGPGKAGWLN